jgi:hypothetical protein
MTSSGSISKDTTSAKLREPDAIAYGGTRSLGSNHGCSMAEAPRPSVVLWVDPSIEWTAGKSPRLTISNPGSLIHG